MRFPLTCIVFIHGDIALPSAIYIRINQPITNSSLFLHGCVSKALVSPSVGHPYMVLCTVPGASITITVSVSILCIHLREVQPLALITQLIRAELSLQLKVLSEMSNQHCQGNYIFTVLLANQSLPAHATGLWSDLRRS